MINFFMLDCLKIQQILLIPYTIIILLSIGDLFYVFSFNYKIDIRTINTHVNDECVDQCFNCWMHL